MGAFSHFDLFEHMLCLINTGTIAVCLSCARNAAHHAVVSVLVSIRHHSTSSFFLLLPGLRWAVVAHTPGAYVRCRWAE